MYSRGESAPAPMKTARVQPLPQRVHSVTPPTAERALPSTSPMVAMDSARHNAHFVPHAAGFMPPINPPNIANLMGK